MERVLKPASRFAAAAVAVVVGAIVIYLGALLNVYLIAWVVQVIQKLG